MSRQGWRLCLGRVAAVALTACTWAGAAHPSDPAWALDLGEEVHRLEVTVTDARGRPVTAEIPLTLFRPAGDGPFPLAVISHGRSGPDQRRDQGRVRYDLVARWLVNKGFAVVVPTRLGYGETFGVADPEHSGSCAALRADEMALAASEQVVAAIDYVRTLPWADTRRWIAVGQSVGGLASLATAWRAPAGLQAVINFSGGAGGRPEVAPADPCGPAVIEQVLESRAAAARAPTLWFYWDNDRYWGPTWPRRWARAWEKGGGQVRLHQLPAVGRDGHSGLLADIETWMPLAEAWLSALGFDQPGDVERPPPSGYAAIGDVDRVPVSAGARERHYRRFLAATPPRAFAIGERGVLGWATGSWARARALGACQSARRVKCRLYAVDHDVVWPVDLEPAR